MITMDNGYGKIMEVTKSSEIKTETREINNILRATYSPQMPIIITTCKKDAEYISKQINNCISNLINDLMKE